MKQEPAREGPPVQPKDPPTDTTSGEAGDPVCRDVARLLARGANGADEQAAPTARGGKPVRIAWWLAAALAIGLIVREWR